MRFQVRARFFAGVTVFGLIQLSPRVEAGPVTLYEQRGAIANYACSRCSDGWRAWDVFSLNGGATITQISAVIADTGGELAQAHTIEFSIWDESRTTQLFAQSFAFSALSPVQGPDLENGAVPGTFEVYADISVWVGAGNYSLSIYDAVGRDGIAWAVKQDTVNGRSFQSFNPDGTGALGAAGNGKDMIFAVRGECEESPGGGNTGGCFPVPELTSTVVYLGSGLVALVALRMRWR